MEDLTFRVLLARLAGAIGGGCGILGVLAAFQEKTWKLGTDGWLLLGILLVVTALTILFDEYREAARTIKR